jgi:hypothetical protein
VLVLHQPAHSVRLLKVIDAQIPPSAPDITVDHASQGSAGASLTFSAHSKAEDPVLICRWDFGDGVTVDGSEVHHTYTEPGQYTVHLTAAGLDGLTAEQHFQVGISGHMPTTFDPPNIRRYRPAN